MTGGLYREQGIVLRTYKLAEADRIVVFLTSGRGKVRAVAKGVRRTTSRFGARLEPTTHLALQLYEGRDLHTVTQAEVVDGFRAVRGDLDRLGRATTLLEIADHVAQEGEPNPRLYRMLLGALRALESRAAALLVPAFALKVLAAEGEEPLLDECAVCGRADVVAFDHSHGGALCPEHRTGLRLSPAAQALCRRILGGELVGALEEPVSPATAEVDAIATRSIEALIDRRLRTPHLLD